MTTGLCLDGRRAGIDDGLVHTAVPHLSVKTAVLGRLRKPSYRLLIGHCGVKMATVIH